MVRYILAGLVPAILFALAGCKTTEVAERPPNPGSHLTQWMYYDLLAGRVTIQFGYYPAEYKNWFVDEAIYHTRDGDSLICEGEKRRYESRIVDGYFFTRSGEDWMAAVTLIGNDDDTLPVFYDPQTGRFHVENWDYRRDVWTMYSDGWVQESWPRAMADACPDLPVPDDLPINELQTHPSIWKMLEQDPTAPFRMPDEGPTRLGIAQLRYDQPFSWCFEAPGRPVLPEHCKGHESTEPSAALPGSPEEDREDIEALAEALREGDGMVLEDRLGRAYVLALHPVADEFWAIDGEGGVLDVGYLAWNAAAGVVELDWENRAETEDYLYRPGDPLPVENTGRRHPLFHITDWLVAETGDIPLPFMGRTALFRFLPEGALVARGEARDFAGAWTVSRGSLVLEVEGIADKASYRWEPLATYLEAHVGRNAG